MDKVQSRESSQQEEDNFTCKIILNCTSFSHLLIPSRSPITKACIISTIFFPHHPWKHENLDEIKRKFLQENQNKYKT